MAHVATPDSPEVKAPEYDDALAPVSPLEKQIPKLNESDADIVPPPRGLGRYGMVFAAGAALFSDGYSNAVAGQVNTILKVLYGSEYTDNHHATVFSSMVYIGILIGQLGFGWFTDRIGRKAGMIICSIIILVFSALSAAAKGAGGSVSGLLAALDAYRLLLGIGLGGEYPCGGVAAAENSDELSVGQRNMMLAFATNCAIDLGFVIASFVPLVLLWICGTDHLSLTWRLSLGLGVVPAAFVLVARIRMREPVGETLQRFCASSQCAQTSYQKYAMKRGRATIPHWLIFRRYAWDWLPMAISWFIYDFITYPSGVYSSTVVDTIIGSEAPLYQVLGWSCVINCFYLPGCYLGAFLIDRRGSSWYGSPKYVMVFFLVFQGVVGYIMSGLYAKLAEPSHIAAFAVLYGIFLAAGEAGPGNNIGVIGSKMWPTRASPCPSFASTLNSFLLYVVTTMVRSLGDAPAAFSDFAGAMAAFGKVGAYAGTWAFPAIAARFNSNSTLYATGPFYVNSSLTLLSAAIIFFFVKDIDADTMAQRDRDFVIYLEQSGYDTSVMGLHGDEGKLEKWIGGVH